jgi:hypothetical protein
MSDEFDDARDPAWDVLRGCPRPEGPAASALPWPGLIAQGYEAAAQPLRVRLLECLLRPMGPLALVVVAAGAFVGMLPRGQAARPVVSPDDAGRFSGREILELARFVEQRNPDVLLQAGAMLAELRPAAAASGQTAAALQLA